jgi:hypothetical protein
MTWNHSFSQIMQTKPRRRSGGYFLAAMLFLLNACAMAETPEGPGDSVKVPEGAIPVSPDLYMLPMGTDEAGCPVFQPWSPTLMVVQALHWRTADGTFTLDRDAADCPTSPADR